MATVWRNRFNCKFCGHSWKSERFDTKAEADAAYEASGGAAIECPNCAKVLKARGIDLSIPKAPATVGQNVQVKAIDETAKVVMQDYGMTDLRTDVREHETMVPKLPPLLQQQADGFFVGRGRRQTGMGVRDPQSGHTVQLRSNPSAIGMAAIKGAYRQGATSGASDPIATLHGMNAGLRDTIRPKTRIVAGDGRPRG